MRIKKFLFKFLFAFSIIFLITGCLDSSQTNQSNEMTMIEEASYYKKDDVIAYLKEYKKLPSNYLTKKEAKKLGWIPKEGNLWLVTDKGVIGGDYFGNFENKLPKANYKECDVNYEGGKRGSERLVFDEDFNIYYTSDHYNSFSKEN